MKKLLLSSTILLMVISCSKVNLDKKENQTSTSSSELKRAEITIKADSADKMNFGKYLKSDLTAQEIDSVSKLNAKVFNKSIKASAPFGPEYTDWSGLVHLQIFSNESGLEQHPHVEVTVPDDYVLVGGGASLRPTIPVSLLFITESRPDANLTKWMELLPNI